MTDKYNRPLILLMLVLPLVYTAAGTYLVVILSIRREGCQ